MPDAWAACGRKTLRPHGVRTLSTVSRERFGAESYRNEIVKRTQEAFVDALFSVGAEPRETQGKTCGNVVGPVG